MLEPQSTRKESVYSNRSQRERRYQAHEQQTFGIWNLEFGVYKWGLV
jgi:hypothetical protein